MLSLTTQYSLWFLPICFIGGFLYAWVLYRKETKLNEVPGFVKTLMFIFRFSVVTITAFLLLSPFFKNYGKIVDNPIILYAQDNSISVSEDSSIISDMNKKLNDAFSGNDYIFQKYNFAEDVLKTDTIDFSGKETDISKAVSELKDRYYHKNIGAMILISDGIFNSGTNPEYSCENLNFPVFTVALGDTVVRKDLILKDIKYNKTAFLNTKFPLRIKITADKLKGEKSEIKIWDNGKLIKTQNIKISENNYYKIYDFNIKAEKTGFHKYKIKLSGIKGELSLKNNTKEIIIEVTDKKQKILILSDAPHPDIAAIKDALKINRNFEIEYFQIKKFNKSINNYNLVILNQLPSEFNSASTVLKHISNSNIPVIYMLGGRSSLADFDKLNTGLTTGAYDNAPDEVNGKLNKSFNLFQVNPEIETITMNAPPLISAFGDYKLSKTNQILFYRTVRNINTNLPLIIFFSGGNNKKTAVITGEGIWRWQIFDFKSNKNHYLFNELINNMVQYMISKDIKSRFEIDYEKIIPENQAVVITARTFDKDYKYTEVSDISIKLTDSLKQISNFKFKKSGEKYSVNLGKLKPGDYKFTAETIIKGRKFKKTGFFSVIPVNTEFLTTKANHKILYKISQKTGGLFFQKNQVSELIKSIKNNENIKPVIYSEKKTEALINFKLIFFIILILLTAEWFLRKFYGSL